MTGLVQISAPPIEPITLAEAKLHCRVDIADDDALINAIITAARQWVEEICNRSLITEVWDYYLDSFPASDHVLIPRSPLQAIVYIKYYGTDGTEYTMDAADYIVDTTTTPGRVVLGYGLSWPTDTLRTVKGVKIEFTAGYGGLAIDVPYPIKQAIKLLVANMYEFREPEVAGATINKVNFAVESLLNPYRVW